jgi:hypothetical protein
MFQAWNDSPEPNIGWCLMCNGPIRTEGNLIPGTSTHNCAEGRALETKIAAAEAERKRTDSVE